MKLYIPKAAKPTLTAMTLTTAQNGTSPKYVTFEGLYRIYGIGRMKAYQLANDGFIRSVKLGDSKSGRVRVLFDVKSVRRHGSSKAL